MPISKREAFHLERIRLRKVRAAAELHPQVDDPTPEQISEVCAAIQATWSNQDYRRAVYRIPNMAAKARRAFLAARKAGSAQ